MDKTDLIVTVDDAIRKLVLLDSKDKIWTQEMLLQVSSTGMERALLREIEELERSIGELTRREARRAGAMTSPEWQTPAVSRRPGGFSGRQENPASVSHDGTLAKPTMQLKLPRFNGTASLESYLGQLELAAQLGGWTPEQTVGHLALALEGPALKVILDLPPAERQNLQALTAALQRRFIQHRSAEASREKLLSRYHCEEESWGKVAADPSPTGFHQRGFDQDNTGGRHPSYPAHSTTNPPARQGGRRRGGPLDTHATTTASRVTVRRAGPYRTRLPSSSTKATEAPVGKRGRDGAVRRTPPREPTLLNQVHTPVPKPSLALPAPVAKIPATSAEASTSAFEKATERKSHPRVGRLGKASGLYLHCQLDGQACRALVDTGATISLVRPGVLHNIGGPQLPGAWTPTATPLTSVTGAKMAMRGKKEVKVTPSITLGTETVALKSCPTRKPARRARHLATTARPASKLLQLATAPKPPSLTTVPQPDHSLAHHHQPATQQPPAQPKPALPAETAAAVHALWQRSSSGLDHQQRQQLKSLLDGNADLFAVRDEDCTQTELVQHTINTDTTQPIRLRPHRMSPAKRLVAEEKEGQSMAFDQLRAALTEAPVLAYPDAQRPFIIDTDASNTGVGAILSQEDEDDERVVAYYSRALGKAERNYCVTRRELLAVVRALHHFRPYLQGSDFLLRTDHASLTWLLNFKDPEGQVALQVALQLQGYDFEIQHRAGRLHGNADALSCRPCAAQECRYCSRQEERD
ncbi:hypothetical protein SKAU_G00247380 [Synaphobranchus kaupii]|uniref:Reverse transcriptase/retrotransposon-derived protein RNase H-like domain-containing protein n=1 Tax=Synaphobranchus kaupii TaxID=118154 RepID=A0A9Q1F257_SYNKA|nr:hypothetical protein SKAU_G00247380 [Synaphobranchus kaupii]